MSYIDTCIVMMFVRKDDNLRRDFGIKRGAIDSILKGRSFCISVVALGEAIDQIRWKCPSNYEEPIGEPNRLLDSGFLYTSTISNSNSTFTSARNISSEAKDDRDQISPMDALIVSSAVTDHTCSFFYTTDGRLNSNSNVSDLISDWRDDNGYGMMTISNVSKLF